MKQMAAIFSAALLCLGGCNFNVFRDQSAPSFVKTCQTGQETQVLAEYSAPAGPVGADASTPPSARTNCLDEAFDVLMQRAYPQPDPRSLARSAVDAMCNEYRSQTGAPIASAHREAWIWTAIRSHSFAHVLQQIHDRQPAVHDEEQLIAAGLAGLLRGAGPKSAQLYTPAVAAAIEQSRRRNSQPEPGVVGLAVDNWPVVDVLPLSPAHQAGLQDGDRVTSVNGRPVSSADSAQTVDDLLAGPVGSSLEIKAVRDGQGLRFRLRRASAASLAVRAAVPTAGLCYIRIPSFDGAGVGEKVSTLVHRARQAGMTRFVLDLRGNTGGKLEEANAVADIFLDRRTLQTFAFRVGQRVVFLSKPGAVQAEVTLLTNRATASAAEMLAMALRDNGAARIVGEDTFGALFGRDQHTLANGYVICFRAELTILSPRGDDYSVTGIDPDEAVEDRRTQQADPILARAIAESASRVIGQPTYARSANEPEED
ncbi:MAG: S41 family peptidase [Phycisphaerae bacterium]